MGSTDIKCTNMYSNSIDGEGKDSGGNNSDHTKDGDRRIIILYFLPLKSALFNRRGSRFNIGVCKTS